MTDFKKLKVVELRAECASRSLPQTGKRDELIERLEEYEFQVAEPSTEMDTEVVETEKIEQEQQETVKYDSISNAPDHPTVISPIPVPINATDDLLAQEEEKRRQRALRFGLDPKEQAPVKIEITIKRLEHALPNRHHRHHRHHKKHKISINKP